MKASKIDRYFYDIKYSSYVFDSGASMIQWIESSFYTLNIKNHNRFEYDNNLGYRRRMYEGL